VTAGRCTIGRRPAADPWDAGVQHPHRKEKPLSLGGWMWEQRAARTALNVLWYLVCLGQRACSGMSASSENPFPSIGNRDLRRAERSNMLATPYRPSSSL
jgi:hypothetical protein